jgi:hypothetical protein
LNVAVNAHNSGLLTLLVSNQFVELKVRFFFSFWKFQANFRAVFLKNLKEKIYSKFLAVVKKKKNLIFFLKVDLRYCREISYFYFLIAHISPKFFWFAMEFNRLFGEHKFFFYFWKIPPNIQLEKTFFAACTVMMSEILVDWIKHAFITKFNFIQPWDAYSQVWLKFFYF